MSKGLTGMRIFTAGSTQPEQQTFFAKPASFPAWQFAADSGLSVCMQMQLKGAPSLQTVMDASRRSASFSTTSPERRPPMARPTPPPRRCSRWRSIPTST
jgi:hypothetical protein